MVVLFFLTILLHIINNIHFRNQAQPKNLSIQFFSCFGNNLLISFDLEGCVGL